MQDRVGIFDLAVSFHLLSLWSLLLHFVLSSLQSDREGDFMREY